MNDKTYINGEELTALANSLKTKSENILSAYKGDCATAIQMSSECLQLSGLNTTEFFQALEKVYNQVNERINSFADFLNNVVVAEYNAVSEAIVSSFNNDFANEMASLLGISVTGLFVSATMKPIPGVPRPPVTPGHQPGRAQDESKTLIGNRIIKENGVVPKIAELKDPIVPGLGSGLVPKPPKDQVIELDPREKIGFIRATIQSDSGTKPVVSVQNQK